MHDLINVGDFAVVGVSESWLGLKAIRLIMIVPQSTTIQVTLVVRGALRHLRLLDNTSPHCSFIETTVYPYEKWFIKFCTEKDIGRVFPKTDRADIIMSALELA